MKQCFFNKTIKVYKKGLQKTLFRCMMLTQVTKEGKDEKI